MRTHSINIEDLDNGFILAMYAYPDTDDFGAVGNKTKSVRKYLTTMEEVTDEIKAFLGVDV